MKKSVLVLMLLAIASTAVFARKQQLGDLHHIANMYDYSWKDTRKALILDDHINVRNDTGTYADVLFQLNTGDEVTILNDCDHAYDVYAEGAWEKWYEISCSKGHGYVCGRWMTQIYGSGDFNNDGKKDFIAYQIFYKRISEYDYEIVRDDFLLIQDGKVSKLTGFTMLNLKDDEGKLLDHYQVEDIFVVQNAADDIFIGVGLMNKFAGSLFILTLKNGVLQKKFYTENYESGTYTKIVFKNKFYDVYHAECDLAQDIPKSQQTVKYNQMVIQTMRGETLSTYEWKNGKFVEKK